MVDWAMAPSMPAERVCTAVAIAQRQPPAGLLMNSDGGSQYASDTHRALRANHYLQASMIGNGKCWDSAVMPRCLLNHKMERAWLNHCAHHTEATRDVSARLGGFYTSTRLHSRLGSLPPNVHEQGME